MKKKEIYFYECQHIFHLKCWYLWLLWIGIDGLFIFGFIKQIIFHESWGNNPMPDTGLIITTVILLIFSLLFIFMRMETVIDEYGCSVRYFPILWKFRMIPWENIEKAYIRKYNFITEYGGWGIRYGFRISSPFKSSKVYNIYGNIGLQLELKKGKRVLIGTQCAEEIEELLSSNHFIDA